MKANVRLTVPDSTETTDFTGVTLPLVRFSLCIFPGFVAAVALSGQIGVCGLELSWGVVLFSSILALIPGVTVIATGGHTAGHQAVVVRGRSATVGFFGDLCMRPWSAEPTWLPSFDDFPLRSVEVKRELFSRASDERWRQLGRGPG